MNLFSLRGPRGRRLAAGLALLLALNVHPAAAQEVSPEACADIKEQIRYCVNEGAFVQDAGVQEGVDLLANAKLVRNAACGTPGDDSSPSAPSVPEPAPTPAPTPSQPRSFGRPTRLGKRTTQPRAATPACW